MDEAVLRRRARRRIGAGTLPSNRPLRHVERAGSGEPCALCELRIEGNEIEDEVEFADGEVLRVARFHRPCAAIWALERTAAREA